MGAVPAEASSRREAAVFVAAIIGMAAVIAVFAVVAPKPAVPGGSVAAPEGLNTFQSDSQLQQFISANAKSAQQYSRWGVGFGGPLMMNVNGVKGVFPTFGAVTTMTALATLSSTAGSSASAPSFTGTNVQVQGVDEPDRVKTDGTHLFVSTQDSVAIINAYQPNSTAVLAKLSFPNSQVLGLEMVQDRLMVIDQKNGVNQSVELVLYDVSNLSSPKMMANATIPGSYVAARMADGFVYAVIQQPSYVFNGQGNATAVLPMA